MSLTSLFSSQKSRIRLTNEMFTGVAPVSPNFHSLKRGLADYLAADNCSGFSSSEYTPDLNLTRGEIPAGCRLLLEFDKPDFENFLYDGTVNKLNIGANPVYVPDDFKRLVSIGQKLGQVAYDVNQDIRTLTNQDFYEMQIKISNVPGAPDMRYFHFDSEPDTTRVLLYVFRPASLIKDVSSLTSFAENGEYIIDTYNRKRDQILDMGNMQTSELKLLEDEIFRNCKDVYIPDNHIVFMRGISGKHFQVND